MKAAGPAAILVLLVVAVATRARADESQCQPISRPPPLSIDAARDAYRAAERRQELRVREAAEPGALFRDTRALLEKNPEMCLSELAGLGQRIFEHEFTIADGLGTSSAPTAKGPFRRVHDGLVGGPETISCPSCHWVGGPAGAGAETDDAFLAGDGDTPASGDARNPQALVGLGVVEALAHEMTMDLQKQRDAFLRNLSDGGAAREIRLVSKGVDFGVLRVNKKGEPDAAGIDGVDEDLVVKPFGWKGTRPDIESFAVEAMHLHFAVESESELGGGVMKALTAHLALLEMPIVEPMVQDRVLAAAATGLLPPTTTSFVEDFTRGREEFQALGCASCHRPMLFLEKPMLEVDGLPPIDLVREMRVPAIRYDAAAGGYPVWLFSDLKRHDMGVANKAKHVQRGVATERYLTPRLWGVADSGPYLHDGRAPSLDYAIAGHDGEGAAARAAYAALPIEEKGALRVYLMSMRRAPRVTVP